MTKHTPGPWHRLTGGVISNTVGSDWANERHFVCKIDCDNAANARLIAAAPDLLEACRILDEAPSANNFEGFNRAVKAARAAIAKATGAGCSTNGRT